MRESQRQRDVARRSGLSVLEFIGCVIAVVGGIWLGAIYLGIDVRHIAYTALAEADLLDKMPAELRPPGPQDTVTREQLVTTLREELGTLKNEIAGLREGEKATGNGTARATFADPSMPTMDSSLAYWMRLNEIALGEAALQADAQSAFDEAHAAKVLAIKSRIGRFAAKAVEALPDERVDRSLVQFGRELSAWYERSGDLYERAVQIWESATTTQGRAQLNEDWKRAELQHKNEARLLREKAAGARSAVSRRFSAEFPPFAQPAE